MQTLGKIAPTRRMPGPAQVRSLRSENEGNDPTVNLVPQGGGGWKSSTDEEEKKEKAPPRTREGKFEGGDQGISLTNHFWLFALVLKQHYH